MQYLERVITCIANTTRYPREILTPEADLENDLGIDSVKRLEITIAIGEEFKIPVEHQTREGWVRTIGDVAIWVSQITEKSQSPAPPVQASPQQAIRQSPDSVTSKPRISPVQPIAQIDILNQSSVAREQPNRIETPVRFSTQNQSFQVPVNEQPSKVVRFDERQLTPPLSFHSRISSPASPSLSRIDLPKSENTAHHGKVAFITGAGHGVGNVIARLLAQQGITVIVNTFHSRAMGEQTAHEIRQAGGSAFHIWGSVANPSHVESMFEQIAENFGKLDFLICNASDGKIGSFLELNSDDWDRAFRTNVSGHYQCALKAVPLMRQAGAGRIVTLSSVGSHSYIRGLGSQGVVKAAVETLTRYLACELGPMGIRVNCIAGGPVYGDLLNKFPDASSAQQHWETMSPDGELCNPIDLANTILFLLGDSARGINGAVLQVDHGFSAVADGRSSRVDAPIAPVSHYAIPSAFLGV